LQHLQAQVRSKAGADHDGRSDAGLAQGSNNAGDRAWRYRDHGKIGRNRKRRHGREARNACNFGFVWIHHQDPATEAAGGEIARDDGPDGAGFITGANQCNRGGSEKSGKIAGRHAVLY
jgi:hypothetical protein